MKKIKLIIIFLISFLCLNVINVDAEDMSERFRVILNSEGKVEVNGIEPTSFDEASSYLREYLNKFNIVGYQFSIMSCSDNYLSCKVGLFPINYEDGGFEDHEINLVYKNADETIKDKIDYYINKIPENKKFLVTDLEAVNYWVNGWEFGFNNKDLTMNMSKYSGELKKFLDNYNIEYKIGFSTFSGNAGFYFMSRGTTILKYNDISYGVKTNIGANIQNVIYVPTETASDKETLMETAQKRINEYLENDSDVVLSYGDLYSTIENGPAILADLSLTNIEHYFIATVGEKTFKVLVVPDSSKMINAEYLMKDLVTGVEVNTSSNIPLDAMLSVSKLTSGDKYDKIMKILNATNSEMFDISLFSQSIDSYIMELENGSFEVKIPISENYKGKKLLVYYVDENDVKHEYPVTLDENYAVFNTNHFSVYTLITPEEINPETNDGILLYIVLGLISIIGVGGIIIYSKKKK